MQKFDYKKEYKEFYMPPKKPHIVEIPEMNFIAVRGQGDPNTPDGEYKKSISILYALAFTIKMSYKGAHKIEGYFDYVVPPLEGLWYQDGSETIDYTRKEDFRWISLIRLPEFVTYEDFRWALEEAESKKKTDLSKAEFFTMNEGLCVQCMHIGPYDNEPSTIAEMDKYIADRDFLPDFSANRLHHEIYLSDARKCSPEKLRTVIRQPIKRP